MVNAIGPMGAMERGSATGLPGVIGEMGTTGHGSVIDRTGTTARGGITGQIGGIAPTALGELAHWVRTLPCPVVALADAPSELSAACDVVVDRIDALTAIDATVRAAPTAAMTFVQLLRIIDQLDDEAALTAESLAYGVLQSGPEFKLWLGQSPQRVAPAPDPGPAVQIDRDGDTLRLTLNRPSNGNSISIEMRDALVEALDLAAIDDSIAAVILTGKGRSFCLGGDLAEFGLASDAATAHWVRSVRSPALSALRCGPKLQAQVHRACIGAGIELPAFAATLVANADSFFQLPELKMGLIPGSGGCVSVTRRIGRQRAALLGLSGRRINATTALEWGLVDRIAAP
jgi:hypothetical protein